MHLYKVKPLVHAGVFDDTVVLNLPQVKDNSPSHPVFFCSRSFHLHRPQIHYREQKHLRNKQTNHCQSIGWFHLTTGFTKRWDYTSVKSEPGSYCLTVFHSHLTAEGAPAPSQQHWPQKPWWQYCPEWTHRCCAVGHTWFLQDSSACDLNSRRPETGEKVISLNDDSKTKSWIKKVRVGLFFPPKLSLKHIQNAQVNGKSFSLLLTLGIGQHPYEPLVIWQQVVWSGQAVFLSGHLTDRAAEFAGQHLHVFYSDE